MNLGAFSISLSVKNINASKEFYEKLGFSVFAGEIDKNYLIMKNQTSVIGLFQGMFENNKLNSYDDVRDIQKELKSKGIKLETEADENSSGPASFVVLDPDGNAILFDQHV